MCDCYPNYKPNNLTETVDVWNMMLSDYTYEQMIERLRKNLSETSKKN